MPLHHNSDISSAPLPLPLFHGNRRHWSKKRGVGREARKEEEPTDEEVQMTDNHFYGDQISLFSDDLTLDWKEEVGNDAAVDAEIGRLARRLIRHRVSPALRVRDKRGSRSVIDIDKDPRLDPYSHGFDPRSWMKALLGSQAAENVDSGPRIASVAFRNLQVYANSTGVEQQRTVGNLPVQMFSMVRDLFRRSKPNIKVLHDFDGVVKDGEMLLVLGRSGRQVTDFS